MNNMKNNYGEIGTFCKSLKIKTIVYAFNNVLLNWTTAKEGLRGFLSQSLSSKVVLGMHYIRVFCKFPEWFLLWTTTMVHNNTAASTKKTHYLAICTSTI